MVKTASTMLSLGTHAPSFSLPDADGRTVSLTDFKNAPALLVMLRAEDLESYIAAFAVFNFLIMLWSGALGAQIQDLVLQRMRGTAAVILSLVLVLVGSGMGPYWVGKISTMTGSLTGGLYSVFGLAPVAVILFVLAARRVRAETLDARRARAAAAGEVF